MLLLLFLMAFSAVGRAYVAGNAAGTPPPPSPPLYISGSWYFGLASCGGKPFTPFNFTANVCSPLDTDDLQVQFKGQSLRLKHPDASRATATLDVYPDGSCGGQPTNWGTVANGACQMSYWSTKYTFFTNFTVW